MRQSINQKINREAFDKLIGVKYEGKNRRLAEDIGMSYVQMWRILTEKSDPGSDFMFRFIEYCKKNELEYSDFFIPTEQIK